MHHFWTTSAQICNRHVHIQQLLVGNNGGKQWLWETMAGSNGGKQWLWEVLAK